MTKLQRMLVIGAVALGACQTAAAVVVGFQYIAHIDAVQTSGHVPVGTLTAGVGNAVVGTFYYETGLTPDAGSSPNTAFYTYQLPVGRVAHHVRFQLPTILHFLFDNTGAVILNDQSLGNVGLPQVSQDEFFIGSDSTGPITQPSYQTHLALVHQGSTGTPVGPFTSVGLPATPPKLADFPDLNEWGFNLYSAGTVPFEDSWSIELTGHLVAIEFAAPEPPTLWLLALAFFATGFWKVRARP